MVSTRSSPRCGRDALVRRRPGWCDPSGSFSMTSAPGSPVSASSYCSSSPERPSLSTPTSPSTERARSPAGVKRLGSSRNAMPGRSSSSTRGGHLVVDPAGDVGELGVAAPASRPARCVAAASRPSGPASAAATSSGCLISGGFAQIVCCGRLTARSLPLRSKIEPRSAGRVMSWKRCDTPKAAYSSPPSAWTWTSRTTMAPKPTSSTSRVATRRRCGRPARRPRRGERARRRAGRRVRPRPDRRAARARGTAPPGCGRAGRSRGGGRGAACGSGPTGVMARAPPAAASRRPRRGPASAPTVGSAAGSSSSPVVGPTAEASGAGGWR